jgi:hypothetical protein
MDKIENQFNVDNLSIEDYQKLVENLRIRINVLNASIFLLEDKLDIIDLDTVNYLGKINSELENIRKMILPYPIKTQNNN